MLLSDIFEHLTYGELSQLAIGIGEDGAVAPTDYPKLVSPLNLGLIDLYKRFPINEKQVVIQESDSVTLYELSRRYAYSNTESDIPEAQRYIMDTVADPFMGNVLRIEEVFNELGEKLPLNDGEEDTSLFTPNVITLQIPQPVSTNSTIALYRAGPVRVLTAGLDPFSLDILLPDSLLEPLLFYVGARVHGSAVPGGEADAALMTKYENSCAWIERQGLMQIENNSNVKPEREGWV